MPSIDERVVAMSFENTVFEARVKATMSTLSKLDTSIKNIGHTNGLEAIEKSANKVTLTQPMSALEKLKGKFAKSGADAAQGLSGIEQASSKVTLSGPNEAVDKLNHKMGEISAGDAFSELEKASAKVSFSGATAAIDGVTAKFSAMQVAGIAAFSTLVSQATGKLSILAGKVTGLKTVMEGFSDYELKIGATQTIMAGTGEDIETVSKYLKDLDTYADKTIYSLKDMTSNIGKFTNAGVKLPVAVDAMKGISNVAALSGASTEDAAHSMYNLGQAIGSGVVRLADWKSVDIANMGTKEFKEQLIEAAVAQGTLKKGTGDTIKTVEGSTVTYKNFNETLADKWLTSDVLTKTLSKYADETTSLGKKAYAAATNVKSFSMMIETLGAAAGTGWTDTFEIIIGDLPQATKLFTELTNTIGGFLGRMGDARNKVLKDWAELGGREELIKGLKIMFQSLIDVIKPVGDAFRQIFPAKSGDDLEALTARFVEFMKQIRPTKETIENIGRTFAGFFAAIHLGWSIITGLAGVLIDLLGVVGKGRGGFLEFTGGIGDFFVALDETVQKGGLLKTFFEGLTEVLKVPLNLVISLGKAFLGLFGGDNKGKADSFGSSLDTINAKLGPLKGVVDKVKEAFDWLVDSVGTAKTALEPWFSTFAEKLRGFGDILLDAFKGIKFDDVMNFIQTGLIAGLLVTLKKALGEGGVVSSLTGAFDSFSGVMGKVTGQLEAMQKKVQAQTILTIAAAMVVLAGGVWLLSTIDGDKLSKAMTAVAVGLGELMGAMKLMMAGAGKLGILQLPAIAAGLVGMSVAVLILAGAMKVFATMSWEDLGKGLAGLGGSLGIIIGAMVLMPPTLPATAAGLILVGLALNTIATAVKIFGSMKLEEIAKGIFAMVEALGGIALGLTMMPPNMALQAAGLILMGIALTSISVAIKAMGSMDFETIIKGLGAMIAAIAGIGYVMWLIPPNMPLMALGLLVVGQAMVVVAGAIAILGNLGVGTLVKGLVGLAGALIILAGGLTLMIVSLPGSLALMVAAAALAVLVPTLGLLGVMKWSTIFKGLAAIALVLVTIGVAGLIAAPALLLLGLALIPLGAAFLIIASAAKRFAEAVALMGSSGQKGFGILLAAITAFVAMLPNLVMGMIKSLLSVIEEVAKIAPKVVVALGLIIDTIIAFIIEAAPKLAVAMGALIQAGIKVLGENTAPITAAGAKFVMDLLTGISANITQITNKVSEIVVKFLTAMKGNAPKLITAGAELLKALLNGISSKFGELSSTVGTMIQRFAIAVGTQYTRMAVIAGELMLRFIRAIGSYIPKVVDEAAKIILSVIEGLGRNSNKIVTKGADVIISFIEGLGKNMKRIVDKGADAVIAFLNGIAESIRTKGPELRAAGWNVADALLDGIWDGIDKLGQKIVDKLGALVRLLPEKVKKILGISSPSKVFAEIGTNTMKGFEKGIDDNKAGVNDKFLGVAQSSMKGLAAGVQANQGEAASAFLTAGGAMVATMRTAFGTHRAGQPSEIFRELGKSVTHGFKDGLLGSKEDVLSAFDSMNDSLIDKIRDLRTQVADGNTKLGDLQKQYAEKLADIAEMRSKKKPDKDAIADAVKESQDLATQIGEETKAVAYNAKALSAARDIRASLTGSMHDEKMVLIGLKKDYDDITKKLEEAEKVLEQMKADEKKWTDQYSVKPDFDIGLDEALADADRTFAEREEKRRKDKEAADKRAKIDQVALYIQALNEQLVATAKYEATLAKLRELGLDDETYKKLLDKGLSGSEFAEQLLKQGKPAIDKINEMDAKILAKSTELAKQATQALYDAGVQTAQGLVDGLKAKKAELTAAMEDLADMMVQSIKKKLKIKSPSQIFAEVGKFTGQGLVSGLRTASTAVSAAAGQLGTDAISAVQSTIAGISTAIDDNIDVEPTITPVLDLTNVQKGAGELSDLTNVTPITAAASYGKAAAISTTQASVADVAADQSGSAAAGITFNQYNTSPESLSDIEIYRQTNNQLALLKSKVGFKV